MPNRNLVFLSVILLVIVIASTLIIFFPTNLTPNLGPAKEITSETLKGQKFSLNSLIGQKNIILDFMATWCDPCVGLGFVYRQILNKYPNNVTIISITISNTDTKDILGNWTSAWNFNWTFLPYNQTFTPIIIKNYNVSLGIPMSYFIDLQGIIRVQHLGITEFSTVENWIKGNYN
ncbi:MAG: peroxiredoxin family protein [Candidatus Thorarchaeota archaeon]